MTKALLSGNVTELILLIVAKKAQKGVCQRGKDISFSIAVDGAYRQDKKLVRGL